MKNVITFLLLTLLLFETACMRGQIVIDLTTGINLITGTPKAPNSAIPYNSIDDRWTVGFQSYALYNPATSFNPPVPSAFQNAAVGNGTAISLKCYYYTQIRQAPANAGSAGISSDVNAIGEAIDAVNGFYYYKRTFDYACTDNEACVPGSVSTDIKSVTLNFDFLHLNAFNHQAITTPIPLIGYQAITNVIINGHEHPYLINPGLTPNGPLTNLSFSIPKTEIVPGQNTIIIVAKNYGVDCGLPDDPNADPRAPLIFNLEGDLTIETYDAMKDADGTPKTQFCMDEDVFLDASSLRSATSYNLKLYYNGNLLAQKSFDGMPYIINVSDVLYDLVPSNFLALNTGTYKIELYAAGACNNPMTKEFILDCCEEGIADGSFSAKIRNTKLQVKSSERGVHEWKVYSTPKATTGPYQYISTKTGSGFSIDIPSEGDLCYYVTHKLSNACGEICVGQGICRTSCEEADCNISMPLGLYFDGSTFSWLPVPGAGKYYLELVMCDPACCDPSGSVDNGIGCAGSNGGVSANQYKIIEESGTSHLFNPAVDLGGTIVSSCFSWRVFAECSNGSRSKSSLLYCSDGSMASRMLPGELKQDLQPGSSAVSENTQVTVFPNPAHGIVSIDVRTSSETKLNISVMNNTGSVIKDLGSFDTSGKQAKVKWDTKETAKGIYLLKIVSSDNQVITRKLIVE